MTIVDVALHKWRMLDDRRRRILIGSIILAILLSTLVIYLVASKSKREPEPEPDPTPTTTTTTTTTSTTTPPTPRPPSTLVYSKDGLALAEFNGVLIMGENSNTKTIDLPGLSSIEVEPEGKPEDKRFKVNLKIAADDLEISCSFVKTEKAIEADQITLSWTDEQGKKQCSLIREGVDINFFHSDPAKHYKCSRKLTYDCDENNTELAHLVIDNLEIEINREKPVDQADLKFETPSFECAN